jgi:hypothetical protein
VGIKQSKTIESRIDLSSGTEAAATSVLLSNRNNLLMERYFVILLRKSGAQNPRFSNSCPLPRLPLKSFQEDWVPLKKIAHIALYTI